MFMSHKTEEFKTFVKSHPGIKKLVYESNKTWQSLFEEWVLYGNSDVWDKYKDENVEIIKEEPTINKNNKRICKKTTTIMAAVKSVRRVASYQCKKLSSQQSSHHIYPVLRQSIYIGLSSISSFFLFFFNKV